MNKKLILVLAALLALLASMVMGGCATGCYGGRYQCLPPTYDGRLLQQSRQVVHYRCPPGVKVDSQCEVTYDEVVDKSNTPAGMVGYPQQGAGIPCGYGTGVNCVNAPAPGFRYPHGMYGSGPCSGPGCGGGFGATGGVFGPGGGRVGIDLRWRLP